MTSKIVTANRLVDGIVVYLAADGSWSERLEDAVVARDADFAEELLAIAAQAEADRLTVGAYLFDVIQIEDGLLPVSAREVIRSLGPSVRGDLGKQAEL